MINLEYVLAHRNRGLTPNKPVIRGTAQNPDVYFQARETVNSFYKNVIDLVKKYFQKLGDLTSRYYKPFEYIGHKEAERVIVIMGSGGQTTKETVEWLLERGEKVGLIKVRLYRPFSIEDFISELPSSVKKIAVLDRTK